MVFVVVRTVIVKAIAAMFGNKTNNSNDNSSGTYGIISDSYRSLVALSDPLKRMPELTERSGRSGISLRSSTRTLRATSKLIFGRSFAGFIKGL